MEISTNQYFKLILFHISVGILLYFVKALSIVYSFLIILIGLYFVIKNKNRNNEVLYVCAYLVGCEALTRMTKGFPIYEFSKYAVVLLCLVGMIFSGFSKNAILYWIFLLLLLPGVIIATDTLNLTTDLRKNISFNISGPLSIGIASIFTYDKKISFNNLNNVLLTIGLPIVSTSIYLILYNPDLRGITVNTGSNSAASGGFGPNQVSTVLGLGLFIFFTRLIFFSKKKQEIIINSTLILVMAYRGLVTFSRGGMVTSFVMIVVLVFLIYSHLNSKGKFRLTLIMVFASGLAIVIWLFSIYQTNGLIQNRYLNRDTLGRDKGDLTTGRQSIAEGELNYFFENPIFGVGVNKSSEYRFDDTGVSIASHNEITRMLSEHGLLGLIALLILLITPMFLYVNNKRNIYIFCFVVFWLFTINHSAMRIAAPSFIYSLALLKVVLDDDEKKSTLHRK